MYPFCIRGTFRAVSWPFSVYAPLLFTKSVFLCSTYLVSRYRSLTRRGQQVQQRPTLAITLGDPSGIGPEVVAKALKRKEIYDKNWLDVEDVYESAGWKVEYDKPGYNENYEPTFTFSR